MFVYSLSMNNSSSPIFPFLAHLRMFPRNIDSLRISFSDDQSDRHHRLGFFPRHVPVSAHTFLLKNQLAAAVSLKPLNG